jgi:hypothetical protein
MTKCLLQKYGRRQERGVATASLGVRWSYLGILDNTRSVPVFHIKNAEAVTDFLIAK